MAFLALSNVASMRAAVMSRDSSGVRLEDGEERYLEMVVSGRDLILAAAASRARVRVAMVGGGVRQCC